MDSVKRPPQHNTKGTPCTIVKNCKSGKPALYIVGRKYACIEHRELAYELARKQRTPVPSLPDVGTFEPEIETVEVEEVAVCRLVRLAQDD